MQRLPHNPKACKYQILIRIPAPAAVTTRLCGRRRTSRRSKEYFRSYCLLSVYITGAGALCLVSSMQPAAIWDLGRGCTVVQPVHSSEMVTKLSIFSIATLKHDPTQLPLFVVCRFGSRLHPDLPRFVSRKLHNPLKRRTSTSTMNLLKQPPGLERLSASKGPPR